MALTWGDRVRVRDAAPSRFRRGVAVVCGLGSVENEASARETGWPLGTAWVTIEFGDGSSVEIPVEHVERVDND